MDVGCQRLNACSSSNLNPPRLRKPGGGGYSSLAYKEGNLFAAFEDDGNITVKNLSEHLPAIEAKALEWNLPNEIPTEVENIKQLLHLNKAQKDKLIAKIQSANDNAVTQAIAFNKEMLQLKTHAAELSTKQVKEKAIALPSKIRLFKAGVDNVNRLTRADNETYLDYWDIQALLANLDQGYALLDTPLDFTPYIKLAKKLNGYNTDIAYSSYDNVFVEYDSLVKNSRYHGGVTFGVNTALHDYVDAGVFFAQKNQPEQKATQAGIRAKYSDNGHMISAFIRYRQLKQATFVEKNRNIDLFVNYGYNLNIDRHLRLIPTIGAYLSYSGRTLLDEDVAINKRLVSAAEIGVDIRYQLADITFNLRPNVAMVSDGFTLSQANYTENKQKVASSNFVYGVQIGVEKRFANRVAIGSKLKLQKYGSERSDVNFGVQLSYRW